MSFWKTASHKSPLITKAKSHCKNYQREITNLRELILNLYQKARGLRILNETDLFLHTVDSRSLQSFGTDGIKAARKGAVLHRNDFNLHPCRNRRKVNCVWLRKTIKSELTEWFIALPLQSRAGQSVSQAKLIYDGSRKASHECAVSQLSHTFWIIHSSRITCGELTINTKRVSFVVADPPWWSGQNLSSRLY